MRGTRVLVTLCLLTLPTAARALREPGKGPLPDLDVRLPGRAAHGEALVLRHPTAAQRAAARAWALAEPGLVLRWDVRSASPKWIALAGGRSLSPASPGNPTALARGFFRDHAALIGLAAGEIDALEVSSVVPAPDGGAHVHFRQTVRGLEVFDAVALANVAADGSVRSASSSLYAGVRVAGAPALDAAAAAAVAVRSVYPGILFGSDVVEQAADQPDRFTVFAGEGFAASPTARLVVFPEAEDVRLAWEIRVSEPTRFTDYRMLVDALDGRVLLRRNLTRYATARVLSAREPEPIAEEFSPDAYDLVSLPDAASPTPESPAGWIDGDGSVLTGNNAIVREEYARRAPVSDPASAYDFPFNTNRAAAVGAWHVANGLHDRLRALGFDEPHGAYQQSNFGLGGVEGDPMNLVAFLQGGRNNAFFSAGAVDGETPYVTFLWSDCELCGDHDGYPENGGERSVGFAGDVIVHEYMHGVTTRLIGGPASACEIGVQGTAMDEGWSDYFAASYYDDPILARYFIGRRGFLRTPLNDMDYADFCDVGPSCGSHDNGEIWQATLWDLRSSFLALDPVGGLDDVDRLLIEGLAASPCFPSFIDARDAILDADTTVFGGAHRSVIWNVFASRGMGQGAASFGPDDHSPVASYNVPLAQTCAPPAAPPSLSAAADGANAIRLSYNAAGAAAVQIWREDLDNPFDRPAWIASTTDTTTFVDGTVEGGKSYRYHVVPLGAAGTPCAGGASPVADATATGACSGFPIFDPQTTVADGVDCSLTVSWQPALEHCPGSGDPVVYDVYRGTVAGFEPSGRTLIGRTTATSIVDKPPEDGRTAYYLVLAQHGTPADPADHHDRGSDQLLRWAPGVPATMRSTVHSWDFDAGPQGWTTDDSPDPSGGWVLVSPSPTHYGGALFAPDEPAGGSGQSWVTGDAGGPSKVHQFDSDGPAQLISPTFDGTGGATLLSFDYWSHDGATYSQEAIGIRVVVDNGTVSQTIHAVDGMTVQDFDTAGRRSWQRASVDLATVIAPTATMQLRFVPVSAFSLTEFGIDNVVIEQGAACARSALSVAGVVVDDSNPGGGNGNGVLEPGETAVLSVELANDGSVTAFAPRGTLVVRNGSVQVHDDTVDFPDIGPGSSATAAGFSITLSPDASCVDSAVLDFELGDAAGAVSRDSADLEFGFPVTATLFTDTFETDQGWIANNDPGAGAGQWVRADPVGSFDGGLPANPEDDSPNDPGTLCYVTENGPPGGDPDANDLDGVYSELLSPPFDFRGYKRARMKADFWYYDDSDANDLFEDFTQVVWRNDDGLFVGGGSGVVEIEVSPTAGWVSRTYPLTMPLVDMVRVGLSASDRGPLDGPSYTDSTVEAALDNVVIEADVQTCNPSGVAAAPNMIGDTLRAARGSTQVSLTWTASPIDGSHDGAAYYRLYVSAAPDAGFGVEDTTVGTVADRALAGSPADEYYLVTAVNEAGDSGDTPVP